MKGIERKIWILVGTRPEVIKQTPVYLACVEKFGREHVALIGTGQHRELLEQALAHFGVKLDFNLDIMKPDQTLTSSSAEVLAGLDRLFRKYKPQWLVAQGDTTSAAMASVAAFQYGIMVAHNEAGLRSYDLRNPFPEEANRRMISVVADLHLAPTDLAKEALLKEGTNPASIHVTGNPGIDALRITLGMQVPKLVQELLTKTDAAGLQPVLLTAHRRENRDEPMRSWFRALARFLESHKNLALVYPIHPNNAAREAAEKFLAPMKQVFMFPAINYGETCHLLDRCRFVVTDSGGIQEEASTLGVPVVVCRKTTERMEAVNAGLARLAGTEIDSVLETMEWAHQKGRPSGSGLKHDIFGDGYSAARMAALLT